MKSHQRFRPGARMWFCLVAVLGLGIGPSAAGLGIARAVLLKEHYSTGQELLIVLRGGYADLSEAAPYSANVAWLSSFSALLGDRVEVSGVRYNRRARQFDILVNGRPERTRVAYVTPSFFDALGAPFVAGRGVTSADEGAGELVAVVSEAALARWGLPPGRTIGRVFEVGIGRGERFALDRVRIVGVAGAAGQYQRTAPPDMWVVEALPDSGIGPGSFDVILRTKDGSSREALEGRVADLLSTLPMSDRARSQGVRLASLQNWTVAPERPVLVLVSSIAALGVLVSASTVALGLLLVSRGRRRENLIRVACGATSPQLALGVLRDCSLLALAGGGVATLVALWLLPMREQFLIQAAVAASTPVSFPAVAALSIGLAAASVAAGSLVPIAACFRVDRPLGVVHRSRWHAAGVARSEGAAVLVQVATSVCALGAAVMLVSAFVRVANTDVGFGLNDLYAAEIQLPPRVSAGTDEALLMRGRVVDAVGAIAGVGAYSRASSVPFSDGTDSQSVMYPRGCEGEPRTQECRDAVIAPNVRAVDASYFAMLGLSASSGRLFDETDVAERRQVAVVTDSLARGLFGERDVIGLTLEPFAGVGLVTIVGVVGEIRHRHLEEDPNPAI
jgi:hypothetical protein